jgi:hypothetical protein
MDFELTPWADEPEALIPKVKLPKLKLPVILPSEGTHHRLHSLGATKVDRAAVSTSLQTEDRTKVIPTELDSFYKVSPVELRAKLTALLESEERHKPQMVRLQPPLSKLLQLRAHMRKQPISVSQFRARSFSPELLHSSFYVRGSRPSLPKKLKAL